MSLLFKVGSSLRWNDGRDIFRPSLTLFRRHRNLRQRALTIPHSPFPPQKPMFDFFPTLDCAGRLLKLDRPRILGVVNVTPDSFADGGRHATMEAAVTHGLRLVEEGADALDIGGESTRPGAAQVSVEDELARVLPVIEQLAAKTSVPISIDTSKPEVMRAAVAAGAGMINDIYALQRDGALEAAVELGVPVILMHMQGEPRTMQQDPHYDDVVAEVRRFLADRIFACELAGIAKSRLVIDPGFGFGKNLDHNLSLLARLEAFADLGVPVLAGMSRKRMIGDITGRDPDDRVAGSVAAHLLAAERGALLLRSHDVAPLCDALAVHEAMRPFVPAPRRPDPARPRWPDEE